MAWSRVNFGIGTLGFGNHVTLTLGWTPTVGNLLVVVGVGLGTTTWSAPTDTATPSNTYTQATSCNKSAIYYTLVTATTSSLQVSLGANNSGSGSQVAVIEYSGNASSSVLDLAASADSGFGTTYTSGNVAATAGEMLVGVIFNHSQTLTPDAPFSPAISSAGSVTLVDATAASTTNYANSGTGGGSTTYASSLAAFKPGGAPPPAGNLFRPAALAGLGAGGPFFGNPLN